MPLPERLGLYDPAFERAACGLGFVATLDRRPTHAVVASGLLVLENLAHRGGVGCDPCTGDGAGMMIDIPDALYRTELAAAPLPVHLPPAGRYGVAMCFLSPHPATRRRIEAAVEASVLAHGLRVLAWRDVPRHDAVLGPLARESAPCIRQLFVAPPVAPSGDDAPSAVAPCEGATAAAAWDGDERHDAFERALFLLRRRLERIAGPPALYVSSCSSRTVVYKGLMLAGQLGGFYTDLLRERTISRFAVVHSRFSTNTFPAWELAHPFRCLAHNGEINTLRGNLAWMAAREPSLASPLFGEHMDLLRPAVRANGSDSASLDQAVELLTQAGRALPHVVAMLVPAAEGEGEAEYGGAPAALTPDEQARRDFVAYHRFVSEPWDGPAALVFADGRVVGAALDRNGLRPAKFVVTGDGIVVLASELGVLPCDQAHIVDKGRLGPGEMLVVDLAAGALRRDAVVKSELAAARPYGAYLRHNLVPLAALPAAPAPALLERDPGALTELHRAFGYTREEIHLVIAPMATTGEEPVGSMGTDVPLACLSSEPQLLYRYFKQQFAQVTNPAIDPQREQIVMSLAASLGGAGNALAETPAHCRAIGLAHPFLTEAQLAALRDNPLADLRAVVVPLAFAREGDPGASLAAALAQVCEAAAAAVASGARVLILSDRVVARDVVPIPSLLAVAAVHQALVRAGTRPFVGLVLETGEAREVAHMALLFGYGAQAICPYLGLATAASCAHRVGLAAHHDDDKDRAVRAEPASSGADAASAARARYLKALRKGLLKVMSKMGISTLLSYVGAEIFEAVGLSQSLIDATFPGTPSRLRGVGLAEIAEDARARHADAFGPERPARLRSGGHYQYRAEGERHLFGPDVVAALQKAVRLESQAAYDEYARLINEGPRVTLRSLLELSPRGAPVALDDVEPARAIVRRFATGAMSFGSISKEAHENLAVAMNRMGGRSNSGEGGEDPERDDPDPNGDWRRSAIRQVASARFGVTADYLVHADELQIKVAQGAKPGEGGQLPGHKVDAVIARVRHATPGVTLISPPPHHDIYSIEDLAQLVYDLRSINPKARVSVKLVAEAGVGVVAAGVAKAGADVILISGHDGGTGASPLTSIHHAGVPWELGVAEAQQVLLLNGLRERVRLQTDGQLRTGRDVAIAALLGAEEFGFATAPLVASGCVMMRKCHLNTCPVGIATQDPELRARFRGTPEHVINYFFFVAEELRRLMAWLGLRTVDEMVGRGSECLRPCTRDLPRRLAKLDLSELLYRPPLRDTGGELALACGATGNARATRLDDELIARAASALAAVRPSASGAGVGSARSAGPVIIAMPVTNRDRAVGTKLSGELVRAYGGAGLPADSIILRLHGTAGQSLGAFLASGITLVLEGDANDYVGKGLSGGVLVVRPSRSSPTWREPLPICGNVVLYGATAGRAFFAGTAGERFAVRNSGATAVVEGVGDHGCEYMTGGTVLVLGAVGRNFGAGMSGGVAYALDEDGRFRDRCNEAQRGAVAPAADEDLTAIRALLEEHVRRTESVRGRELLADFGALASSFVVVVPHEFRGARAAAAELPERVSSRERHEPRLRLIGG